MRRVHHRGWDGKNTLTSATTAVVHGGDFEIDLRYNAGMGLIVSHDHPRGLLDCWNFQHFLDTLKDQTFEPINVFLDIKEQGLLTHVLTAAVAAPKWMTLHAFDIPGPEIKYYAESGINTWLRESEHESAGNFVMETIEQEGSFDGITGIYVDMENLSENFVPTLRHELEELGAELKIMVADPSLYGRPSFHIDCDFLLTKWGMH